VSESAELTRPMDEAGPTAGPGATVEMGKLERSPEMEQSVAPRSAAAREEDERVRVVGRRPVEVS
jgi:hypothetical protein